MNDRIGLFGGTFDPIHFGHLKLAKDLASLHHLKEVWFCPAKISPHKLQELPAASIEHRMNMVKAAIENEKNFHLLAIEAEREGPSYTIDTIKQLLERERLRASPRQICLMLSEEAIPGFIHWKNPGEIVKLVPLLIGRRLPAVNLDAGDNKEIGDAIKKGWTETAPLPISSTEIRSRLRQGLDCREYLPQKVLDYIYQNKLYYYD